MGSVFRRFLSVRLSGAVFRRASDLLAYLSQCPILDALSRREAAQVALLMRWQQFLPDEVILRQNEMCSYLLIVMKGGARGVRQLSRDGPSETLERYEEGSCMNYLCLLQDLPNSMSVVAEPPQGCIVAKLSRSRLEGLLGNVESLLDRHQGDDDDNGKGYAERLGSEVKKTWARMVKMAGSR
ncbi:cyclic nucleotide-binding domain-containing protein [Besnoitia besnoiti]|uniref:Cyclic nucleotide-binding domain-containing protein n=1 Tax=Besnoitia besnoiti TaxID=94643 RepID=A0A2A9M5U2_BESBE|nr:cyclic nucleotide-binding domain-containing protein [Besnoitia besnoiti]PFH31681.1 cyclic nucleotide-binding domain-containing protein [Besnoitia besnoiti]